MGLKLLAWIGEDEYGSGDVGLKQVMTKNGVTATAGVDKEDSWIISENLKTAMEMQSVMFGKTLYLVRYKLEEIVEVITPEKASDPED